MAVAYYLNPQLNGARGRTRTDTVLLLLVFETNASTIPPLGHGTHRRGSPFDLDVTIPPSFSQLQANLTF
jgi:hypothetical protein